MPMFPRLVVPTLASQHPVSIIGEEHHMRCLPSGVFAMGSKHVADDLQDARPHMVKVSPFRAGIPLVSEGQYQKIMGQPANQYAPSADHPATCALWRDWEEYMRRFNTGVPEADRVGFLTEAEGEYAARGPAVDVRRFMGEIRVQTVGQLVEYLRCNGYCLENFIPVNPVADPERALELGVNICTDVHSDEFKKLINGTGPVFAWYGFATLSGRLAKGEACYGHLQDPSVQQGPVPVSLSERMNRFGIADAMGNVWEWRGDLYGPTDYYAHGPNPVDPSTPPEDDQDNRDRVIRGAAFSSSGTSLRVAYRINRSPGVHYSDVGCRLGAAAV